MVLASHPPNRLLLVTNTLVTGGAERMLMTLARSLDRRRVVPVVACLKRAGPLASELTDAGIEVHADLLRHKADLFVIERLIDVFRRERIDAVCAVGSGGDRMFWSTLAARLTRRPAIVWSHVHPCQEHRGFERANRALYRWVDAFVALGRRHRQALVRFENVPAGRTIVIRNGIDVEAFDRPDLRPEARRRLGLPGEETVAVGIVANLRPDKRHDVFVEAARRICCEHDAAPPSPVFYVIGDGPTTESVTESARRSGLGPDRLRLLGKRDDVPVLLQGLDVVCLCSQWQECLSISMLEAMAAGRAFVGPAIGSLDEALIDRQTGRVIRPGDADSLVEALRELIHDGPQRELLGRQARAKVLAEFRQETMARAFERLVASLCERGSAQQGAPCCVGKPGQSP
ncbi:MAG: glycosyltransferase [Phycisphaerae bacterium]|nr:glycosyltransferase [Phycisphaerae bacterium]